MSNSGGRILIIRGGAIGDFVLTLPVFAALRAQLPRARLEVLGYRHIARLAELGGLVDDIRSIEARPMAGFFARDGELSPELRDYFSSFAIIVSYLFDPDGVFQTNVASCSKAQFIAGPHRPDEQRNQHASEVFLRPLERLAIFGADPVPRLNFAGRLPSSASQLAVHPGSGSERKNWPEAKWAKLLPHLIHRTSINLLLVGGEAEGERLGRLAAGLPPDRFQIIRSLSLVEVAEHLSGCGAFLGHDSGITHLAAAIGLPVVALWGETNEAVWRPLGERIWILRDRGGLSELPVATVAAELEGLMASLA